MRRHEGGSAIRRALLESRLADATRRGPAATAEADALRVDLDAETVRTRRAAFREMGEAIDASQTALASKLQRLRADGVNRLTGVNLITAWIPIEALSELENDASIDEVSLSRTYEVQLSTSVPATGAQVFWTAGITGRGETVAVIDTGVRPSHPAFRGVNLRATGYLENGKRNVCFGDDSTSAVDQQMHGTHVNGTVAGQGIPGFANNFGVARGIGQLISFKAGFRTKAVAGQCLADRGSFATADWLAGVDYLIRETPTRVINMSFGGGATADDDLSSRKVDFYAETFGVTFVIAAGNEGPGGYTVGSPGISYNSITVANMNTRGTVSKSDDTIAQSSSRGPTLGLRNKPDLAAPGTDIMAADLKSDGLVALTGTSMASPHVAGAAALIRDAGVTDPLSLKALMINSTDAQSAWLSTTGWGFINLSNAYAQRDFIVRDSLAAGSKRYYRGSSGSLRATLVWNRRFAVSPVENERATTILNNLDLVLYNRRDNSAVARSASPRNNVEVVLASGAGDYVVKVESNETTFPGAQGDEPFALALSAGGFTEAQGPNPELRCASPASVASGSTFTLSCTATNRGDLDLARLAATPQLPSGFTGGTQQTYNNLAPGQSQTLTWSIRAGTAAGQIRVNATGSAFEEAYPVTSNTANIAVSGSTGGVTLTLSQSSLAFAQQTGASLVAAQTISITATGGATSLAVSSATSNGGNWLTASLSTASAPSTLTIRPATAATSLATGSYSGTVTLTSANAVNSPLVIAVRLEVTPQASTGLTIVTPRLARTVELVNGCPEPTAITQFNATDATAYFWFIARGARVGDAPVLEWIRTADNSVYQRSSLWNPTAAGNYCFAPTLDISRIPAAQRAGQWRARLLWNGQQVANETFSIVSPPVITAAVLAGTKADPGNCDLEERTAYRTTDEVVKACFMVQTARTGDRFSLRYVRPDGTQHDRFDAAALTRDIPSYYIWSWYAIKGFPVAGYTGEWKVEFLWNGIAIRTLTFRLNPPVTVETSRVTNADPDSLGCADPGNTRYFLPRDLTATMWFSVADALTGDNLYAEFVKPNGQVYDRVDWDPIDSDGSWCFWTWIDVKDTSVASTFGKWTVRVVWNGAKVIEENFQMQPVDVTGFMVTRATVPNALCSTPVENTNFVTTDLQARLWFTVDLTKTGDLAVVEWLNPSGTVTTRASFSALTEGGEWCFASTLAINGQNRPVGEWTVRALWNGTEIIRTNLRIDRPGIEPTTGISYANADGGGTLEEDASPEAAQRSIAPSPGVMGSTAAERNRGGGGRRTSSSKSRDSQAGGAVRIDRQAGTPPRGNPAEASRSGAGGSAR
jgi:subtilisin family serine protease